MQSERPRINEAGGPSKRPNHASTTARTKHKQQHGTTQKHALGLNDHETSLAKLELLIGTGAQTDGGTHGRTDGYPQIRPPSLATLGSSRARSFARSHARTQRKRNRNRFPGSGVGLTSLSSPPTSDKSLHHFSYRAYLQ